jgi:hypothetical protein
MLTQGKVALVSNQDYWLVAPHKWCASNQHDCWYAVTNVTSGNGKRYAITMHRLLAGFPPFDLDHKNRNGLDNRRRNLRPASCSENLANTRAHRNNTSGYKCVWWSEWARKWQVGIRAHGKRYHVGYFLTAKAAHAAYSKAAEKYFGEFARI